MRESIGFTWILMLVITFTLIFIAFLSLMINYSRAFRMKNQLMNIVEKYEGVQSEPGKSLAIINNYLIYHNYTIKGKCDESTEFERSYGATSLESTDLEEVVNKNTRYYYCIKKNDTSFNIIDSAITDKARYSIRLFYKFSLPVMGDITVFPVNGTTIEIKYPNDSALR